MNLYQHLILYAGHCSKQYCMLLRLLYAPLISTDEGELNYGGICFEEANYLSNDAHSSSPPPFSPLPAPFSPLTREFSTSSPVYATNSTSPAVNAASVKQLFSVRSFYRLYGYNYDVAPVEYLEALNFF